MCVPELWLFKEDHFELYRLIDDKYETIGKSHYLPKLDFSNIAELAGREDQHAALGELKEWLGKRD